MMPQGSQGSCALVSLLLLLVHRLQLVYVMEVVCPVASTEYEYYNVQSCIEVPSARKLFPPAWTSQAPKQRIKDQQRLVPTEGHAIGKLTAGIVSGCCRYRPRYRPPYLDGTAH